MFHLPLNLYFNKIIVVSFDRINEDELVAHYTEYLHNCYTMLRQGIVQIVSTSILIRLYISCGFSGHTSKVSEKLKAKLTQRCRTMNRWNKAFHLCTVHTYTHIFISSNDSNGAIERIFQWKIDSKSEKLKPMFGQKEKIK